MGRLVSTSCRSVKKKGEDTFSVLDVVLGGVPVHLSLVADGHGGDRAAAMCASELLTEIAGEAKDSSPKELERAMKQVFIMIHERIRAETTAGAAVTVVAINMSTHTLTCANVGDSVRVQQSSRR